MRRRTETSRLTLAQIATVLHAVATVEGWEESRPSVIRDKNTGAFKIDANFNTCPSRELVKAVREVEARQLGPSSKEVPHA